MLKYFEPMILFDVDGAPGGGTENDPNPEGDGAGDAVAFSPEQQEVLNKMFAKTRKEATRKGGEAAVQALLGELGVEDVATLKTILDEVEAQKKGKQTELEQANELIGTLRGEAEEAKSAAKVAAETALRRVLKAEVKAAALGAGFHDWQDAFTNLPVDQLLAGYNEETSEFTLKGTRANEKTGLEEEAVLALDDVINALATQKPYLVAAKGSGIGTPKFGAKKPDNKKKETTETSTRRAPIVRL